MQSPTRRTARFTTIALALLLVAQAIILLPAASAAPQITNITPTNGTENGGTTITITGTGIEANSHVLFRRTGDTDVSARSITVTGTTTITAVTPPIPSGGLPWSIIVLNS